LDDPKSIREVDIVNGVMIRLVEVALVAKGMKLCDEDVSHGPQASDWADRL
jgi:hypothetical protein